MKFVHMARMGALAMAGSAGLAHAGLITDASFFNSVPTALINFETDGLGTPIVLAQGGTQQMPNGAYANVGVVFLGIAGGPPVYWVNDGAAAFDAAQALGGSLNNAIPSSLCNAFTITFSVNVKAFAFFVANNRTVDPLGPTFVARDSGGNILETAQWGAAFVDGTITAAGVTADYGIMGIFSATNIASVTITKQAAIMDDLRYSSVPAPGAVALGGAGVCVLVRRRRR